MFVRLVKCQINGTNLILVRTIERTDAYEFGISR